MKLDEYEKAEVAEDIEKLCAALESGEYPQGYTRLATPNPRSFPQLVEEVDSNTCSGYCCLGVGAMVLDGAHTWEELMRTMPDRYLHPRIERIRMIFQDIPEALITRVIGAQAKFTYGHRAYSLPYLNDTQLFSFEQIAKLIRHRAKELGLTNE